MPKVYARIVFTSRELGLLHDGGRVLQASLTSRAAAATDPQEKGFYLKGHESAVRLTQRLGRPATKIAFSEDDLKLLYRFLSIQQDALLAELRSRDDLHQDVRDASWRKVEELEELMEKVGDPLRETDLKTQRKRDTHKHATPQANH